MWALLDVCAVLMLIKAGNKKPYLQVGWMFAACFVTITLLFTNSVWQWGWVETASVFLTCVCAWFWMTEEKEKVAGLFACSIAMFVAGVPQIYSFWNMPQQDTWWLWACTLLACIISFAGAPKFDVRNTLLTLTSAVYNVVILAVLFRKEIFT
jgi:uncharacterized membrane protein YbaN (DUF454 family)